MGHTKCGAVTAVAKGAELHGHLHALADKIKPAVEKAKSAASETDELVPRAIQANVWQTIEDIIKQSDVVREKLVARKVSILGAVYDLENGKVTWLGQHPAEDSLIALAAQAETDHALKTTNESHADNNHAGQAEHPPKAAASEKNAPAKTAPKLAGPGDHH